MKIILKASKLENSRQSYVVGSVLAALQAKNCGLKKITLIEFGVAKGEGLKLLIQIASFIRRDMDLEVSVLGFDNRTGLPDPLDYRDHPEIWSKKQFSMGENFKKLDDHIRSSNAKLMIGDVADTLSEFKLNDNVLAFASIDVDYYSSTKPIMNWIKNLKPLNTLPASVLYFDDVCNLWTYSNFTGEALAIKEFNLECDEMKIELKHKKLKLFALHNFSHPIRTGNKRTIINLELFIDKMNKFYP
tara:strand:- start:2591 stop:3325 length:735 start_codon:yes stop_codon:yes gene_type:complete